MDIATANQNDSTVSVLLGNGDGTFQGQIQLAAAADPFNIRIQDLDGDGKNDIVTANANTNIVSVFLNTTIFNHSPAITSNGGGDTAATSIAENTTAVTTVTATDPDAGQNLSYSIFGGADAVKFAINSTTGAPKFVSAPDFEAPTDAGGNNVYDVIVQASDGAGGVDKQAIAVTVTNVGGLTINGGNGGQTLNGTAEEDTITGGNGKDALNGGAGNDTLSGGNGVDILNGGLGNDKMTGGNGKDTFGIQANFGKDVITDFSNDTIQIDHNVFANFAAVQSHAAQVGANTVITYDANNTITLQGVAVSSLHASDFAFV